MEKYFAPGEPLPEKPSAKIRRPWKRSTIELNGRLEPAYQDELYGLLTHSYFEIGVFPHFYHLGEEPCPTHVEICEQVNFGHPSRNQGVAGLEFDSKGIYLVSVTRSGCLTVHDFESLYCQTKVRSNFRKDESKHVVHFSLPRELELDVVRWNPTNQNELACASIKSNKVLIFDISYISSTPVEVLQTREKVSVLGRKIHRGLRDIAFTTGGDSRVFSSDTHGIVNVWDRRVGDLPCSELSTKRYDSINSIQINVENQTIFGAGKEGIIHIWDLRGGRTSTAFRNHNEVCHSPIASLHLATMLQKIGSLKAQSEIVPKEIHSIDLNPSCPYQLAFHLDDGWSGVLDVYSSEVTHVHCPPPAWLDGSDISADMLNLRKPSWLPTSSELAEQSQRFGIKKLAMILTEHIYVVGSMSKKGIHILDFHPSLSSPCHVDYDEDLQRKQEMRQRCKGNNRFLPLSEGVTVCAAHPLNSTIIAGTKVRGLTSPDYALDFSLLEFR